MTYIFDLGVIYSGAAYFFCGFLLLISFQLYSGQTQHKEQPQNTAFELYIYKASNYMAMHGQIIGFVPCAWQPEESSQNLLEEIVIGSAETEKSLVCVSQRSTRENCIVQLLRFIGGCIKIKKD